MNQDPHIPHRQNGDPHKPLLPGQGKTSDSLKICSICKTGYTGFGNNAQPVNDGRCCDECNQTVVIPRRMRDMRLASKKKT